MSMALAVCGRELVGKKVILYTDNQTETSKLKLVMNLLRPLIFNNIQCKGVQISGVHNVKADLLYR